MSFPDSVVQAAWRRSGGVCECERSTHMHRSGKCTQRLIWSERGNDVTPFGWEAHHKTAVSKGGSDTLSNCEILCISCHKRTQSYGRS